MPQVVITMAAPIIGVDAQDVYPVMVDQLPNVTLLRQHPFDGGSRCLNQHGEPSRFMAPVVAVMNRLKRQSDPQVATVALQHTEGADHVVKHLITAAQALVIDG